MTEVCERETRSGCGSTWLCDRERGHTGEHRAHWIDRDGVRRLGLRWTHESYDGHAVWPGTPGAIAVVGEEPVCHA
jgi:hypothetical protein